MQVTENASAELDKLCIKLNICCFNEKEVAFLKQFYKVLQPLATGLDILQGENKCFYGIYFYLRTLETVFKKVRGIKADLSTMTAGLAVFL